MSLQALPATVPWAFLDFPCLCGPSFVRTRALLVHCHNAGQEAGSLSQGQRSVPTCLHDFQRM